MRSLASRIRPKHRFAGLLFALWSLLLLPPILRPWMPVLTPLAASVAFTVLMARTLAFDTRLGRATRALLYLLVVLVIAGQLAGAMQQPVTLLILPLEVLVMGLLVGEVMRSLFSSELTSADRLYAACCGYLLLGVGFAAGYQWLEKLVPGSVPGLTEHPEAALYFSLVTLATLGYGDMAPALPVARMVAVSESLLGQLYIAVIVARLVGSFANEPQ